MPERFDSQKLELIQNRLIILYEAMDVDPSVYHNRIRTISDIAHAIHASIKDNLDSYSAQTKNDLLFFGEELVSSLDDLSFDDHSKIFLGDMVIHLGSGEKLSYVSKRLKRIAKTRNMMQKCMSLLFKSHRDLGAELLKKWKYTLEEYLQYAELQDNFKSEIEKALSSLSQ